MTERKVPCLGGDLSDDCVAVCPFRYHLPGVISDAARDTGISYDEMASLLRRRDMWAFRQMVKQMLPEFQCDREASTPANSTNS